MNNQKGLVEIIALVLVAALFSAGAWYFYSNKTSPTPPLEKKPIDKTINYDELRQTTFDVPSEIPLYPDSTVEEKFVGFDKDGHKVYRTNISHKNAGRPYPTLEELYNFYTTSLINTDWNIQTDEKKFCSDSVYFCPEWIKLIASKASTTLTIFYLDSRAYIQWYEADVSNIAFTIDPPLQIEVFPTEFQPDLLLVQTEIAEKEIYLETYEPLITTPGDHENLLAENGYPRCVIGSVPMILGYSCSTEDESKRYFVTIVPAETYTFDIVTIRYTEW